MDEFSSGLTEQQLKYGSWYATHQLGVRRGLLIVAWAVIGILFAYSAYGIVDWFALGGAKERALILGMQNDKAGFAAAKARNSPRELSVMDTLSLPDGDAKVDFVSRVKNDNAGWWAEIDYAFSYGSAETKTMKNFILPGEEVWLAAYGVPDAGGITPTFKAKEIRWRRVSSHDVGPYAPFAAARLRFDVTPPQTTSVDFGGKRITKIVFTVTNRSSYAFWHVPFVVSFDVSGAPGVLQEVTVDDFKAGEVRNVEATWYSLPPAGGIPRAVPHVNIFDAGNYVGLQGAPTPDLREERYQPIQEQR